MSERRTFIGLTDGSIVSTEREMEAVVGSIINCGIAGNSPGFTVAATHHNHPAGPADGGRIWINPNAVTFVSESPTTTPEG